MRRRSIRSTMIYVGFIAFGLAALRNANELWASALVALSSSVLGVSILGTFHRRGIERGWWFGFAVFGCGYMLLAFGPVTEEIRPWLPTSQLSTYLRTWILPPGTHQMQTEILERKFRNLQLIMVRKAFLSKGSMSEVDERLEQTRALLIQRGSAATEGMQMSPVEQRRQLLLSVMGGGVENTKPFDTVAHCVTALLAGLIGAVVSS